jgi:hypothetical protein
MSENTNLKDIERKIFSSTFQDGTLDILIGSVILMFAIAPLLSNRLGDFWSSAIFLPFWGMIYMVIYLIRKYWIIPRIGKVVFSRSRKLKLTKLNLALFLVLLGGFLVGIFFSYNPASSGWIIMFMFGLNVLLISSLAGYFLDLPRIYVYGFLVALAPIIGEWLYLKFKFAHHGFPIVFGIIAGTILITGFVYLLRVLSLPPASLIGVNNDKTEAGE